MTTMSEIAEYGDEELASRLEETRRELLNLRFQLATGQLDNSARLGHVRKDIARMLTELRNREIAEAEGIAFEELPAHQAAARQRSEDAAVGRVRSTAGERKAAARAAEEAAAEATASDEAAADDEDAAAEVAEAGGPEDAVTGSEASDEEEEG